jgi:hypothetical protein
LNDFLSVKTANINLIPYYKQYDLVAVVGQEKYFVPGLLSIETLTYNNQQVRYSTNPRSRREYFGTPRVNNINSLMYDMRFERSKGGGDFYLYFKPNSDYPIQIWGKFGLEEVEFNDDLSLVYDRFYITYLRYGLAAYICSDYQIPVPPTVQVELSRLEKIISRISPPDLSTRKLSALRGDGGLNWAIVNFGGWTT